MNNHPPSNAYKGTSGGQAICFSACEDDQLAEDTSVRYFYYKDYSYNSVRSTAFSYVLAKTTVLITAGFLWKADVRCHDIHFYKSNSG